MDIYFVSRYTVHHVPGVTPAGTGDIRTGSYQELKEGGVAVDELVPDYLA
jgi:hypothetical protein